VAILGNKNSLIEEEAEHNEKCIMPAVIRKDEKELSLKKSIFFSVILHPAVIVAIWLIILILALLGITFSIFERPKPKINDIEFVLVDNAKEQMPLNKKTPFRSDRNTRTGGKTDPKRKVSMPSPSPAKKSVQQKSSPGPKAPNKQTNKKTLKPQKNIFKQLMSKAPQAKPQPPSARPSLKPPSLPKVALKSASPFAIPVPKSTKSPTSKTYSTGPVGGNGNAKTGGNNSSKGSNYAPVPSLAPTSSGGGGSSGSKLSKGGSGYGNLGNPGGGTGAPGIDSLREPDFGPYMRELQRRIKMNWEPPKGNESKRVVLLFKIARDGRLLSARVFKSSGLPNADRAAISAVELTAPFKPLPADFKGSSIDIQFTFDYNVFGASGYN
jgi:TonB family protein